MREHEALGFSTNTSYNSNSDLNYEFGNFLKLLQTSISNEHKNAYMNIKDKKIEEIEILGVVVYGTRDQILEIMNAPIIKSASLGGIIDNY
ncbi:anti sigma factor C-terminal domain-containing protein [Alkalihalobacterium alkalinitrilicum]|uniref:anti sigma factor C-terminal domain-containing protein n=1 Tax=Alkalihalobacterium alkalinitrilicum TaxID=427920 RepID=UPI0009952243